MEGRDERARAASPGGGRLPALLVAVAILGVADAPASAELAVQDPGKVEAAYLRNFARYVTWPETAFHGPRAPWQIGVLGREDLGALLERMLEGRTEQDRPFEVRLARSVDALRGCHIVFIGWGDPARRRATLAELAGRPVLTVGDADDFLEEGGIVQFDIRDTVQMRIDLDHARAAGLRIPTKMLEVSRTVVENGVTRALR
jgi:hypothetical protein